MSTPGAPIHLSESDKSRLIQYFDYELEESLQEHCGNFEPMLDKWQKAYEGEPVVPVKNFPWDGACNIVVPLIGIAVDSIVARLVNTVFAVDPFWTVRPLTQATERHAKPVQDFMEWSRKREFNMYKIVRAWAIEVIKFGWGYIKVPWDIHTQRSFTIDRAGKPQAVDRLVRRPWPQHVLLMDIVCQLGIEDELNQAEWMAHRVRLTDGEIRWRVQDGMYEKSGIDDIIRNKGDISEVEERLASTGDVEAKPNQGRPKLNTLYEIWCTLPLGREKIPVDMVITYHKETRSILRAMYNPHITGLRPFVKGKFIEHEGRRAGYGIARHLMALQEEITTLHCQQVDNATLANTRWFLGRKGVVKNNTRIWPGRFLTVPNPKEDVIPMQLGEVYPSMRALEVSALSYAERRSGVSDYQLGRESDVLGGRATATGTLALIQEGNRRFDLNVRDMRDALGQVGQIVLLLNAQFRPKGIEFFVQGQDGQLTRQVFDLPEEFIVDGIGVELTASTSTINKEVEKQGLIMLMQVTAQYYERLTQTSILLANPQAPPEVKAMAVQIANSSRMVMERLVQQFDVKNIDGLLPAIEGVMNLGANFGQGPAGGVTLPFGGGANNGGMAAVLPQAAGNALGPPRQVGNGSELGGSP